MRKNKPQQKKKFRFLLDSAFANPDQFPKLAKKAKLVHVVLDLGLSPQAEDKEIYQKAFENSCFVLTINFDDFKKLIKSNGPGVIGVESQLSNEDIDKIVSRYLSGKKPNSFIGKAVKIDKELSDKLRKL